MAEPRTSLRLLARNALLNLLTEGWSFLVLVFAIPAVLSALGESAFGLFSLAWVLIGYLTVFDIGVSRAATICTSGHLAEGNTGGIRCVVRTALLSNLVLGTAAGLITLLAIPCLMKYVVKAPPNLTTQAHYIFYMIALAMPVLLVQAALRGILSSYQRFDWINLVNGSMMTVQWIVAWLLAKLGFGVSVVVLSTIVDRLAGTVVLFVLCLKLCPDMQWRAGFDARSLLRLYRLGSWMSVSQVVSPLLVYLDRLFISAFLSLRAVSLYTVPYEAVFRLRVISVSATSTLFPAFSEASVAENHGAIQSLYQRSVQYLSLVLLPGVILMVVLGNDILRLWLGAAFSRDASGVVQVLAFGVFVNGLANLPSSALQALGRPDLPAKFHLLELPIYVVICFLLITHWGIAGAAIANTVRVTLDAALLFAAAQKCLSLRWASIKLTPVFVIGVLLLIGLLTDIRWIVAPTVRVGVGLFLICLYFLAIWSFILDDIERPIVARILKLSRPNYSSDGGATGLGD